MYKVVTTQESQTNEAKSGLSFTRMNVTSSVRTPMNKDSHVKNSVVANSKNSTKKVAVYVRKNKQTDDTSANVISNKENVIDVNVANAFKAKTLLCVSCMQNVLIPCHDKCLANYKLNVHSNVCRAFTTNSRTPKSLDTTYVVLKTRFYEKLAQSKSLDTTFVVSKPKIDVGSISKVKHKVVQIVLWIVDSGCSKHMTSTSSLLKNFVEKFTGTVRFGNDHFAAITGYGDYVQGNITICHVYYVEGLGHNLFSVGQFCDGDLEVAFCLKTYYVRNFKRDDLLIGDHESNLYTISISDMAASSPVCLMSKATSTKSCKKASHPPKLVPSSHSKLELLHMDLYETPEIIKKFIAQVQLNYDAKIYKILTDNGTEFKNATLKDHYEKLGRCSFHRLLYQNRSIIHTRHNKTPYELLRGRKPNVEYFHVFGSLCYPTNDRDDLEKIKPKADIVSSMSDSEDSTVTYTEISSPYEDLSDIGSPGAEGPIFQDPPSPDYVPGPEEPEQAPPSPIYVPFVPEPVYPKFLPEDDVLPVEEQPLPVAASPTTESPGYILESDPEEDPEEDDEEDPEEDPTDYPADRGDDRDDEEPSDDDDDDDDDAEEEEHLAPADPAAVAYSAD
ncbi:integrase, catalytic region, zinc finger, CCHC-type containing protein [Tanacetum coccineum]